MGRTKRRLLRRKPLANGILYKAKSISLFASWQGADHGEEPSKDCCEEYHYQTGSHTNRTPSPSPLERVGVRSKEQKMPNVDRKPTSKFKIPCSLFLVPCSLFLVPCSLFGFTKYAIYNLQCSSCCHHSFLSIVFFA